LAWKLLDQAQDPEGTLRQEAACLPSDERGFFFPADGGSHHMSYIAPAEFAAKMVEAGESKVLMSTKDTLIRAYMAGAILALAAAFAVTVTVNTGNALVGALLVGASRINPSSCA